MTNISESNCQQRLNSNPISSLSVETLFEELQTYLCEASSMLMVICDQDFSDYPNEVTQSYLAVLVKHLITAQSTSKLLNRMVCNI